MHITMLKKDKMDNIDKPIYSRRRYRWQWHYYRNLCDTPLHKEDVYILHTNESNHTVKSLFTFVFICQTGSGLGGEEMLYMWGYRHVKVNSCIELWPSLAKSTEHTVPFTSCLATLKLHTCMYFIVSCHGHVQEILTGICSWNNCIH